MSRNCDWERRGRRVMLRPMVRAVATLLALVWVGTADAAPSRREVRVTTEPEGAMVYLETVEDGPICDATPCTLELPVGDNVVILELANHERLYEQIDPEAVRQSQARLAALDGVGQRHMVELHGGALGSDARSLEVSPNLWAGVGLVRGGAGTALVGSYTEVADRIEEYHSVGIDEFILSGYPHLEEAYWFGEGVRPELARRGLLS